MRAHLERHEPMLCFALLGIFLPVSLHHRGGIHERGLLYQSDSRGTQEGLAHAVSFSHTRAEIACRRSRARSPPETGRHLSTRWL